MPGDLVPPTLAAAFANRALIPMTEAANLLGMSPRTLRQHAARGEISYRVIGTGDVRPRRMFGLDDCLEFLERRRTLGTRTRFADLDFAGPIPSVFRKRPSRRPK